jgi:hypothetical protein
MRAAGEAVDATALVTRIGGLDAALGHAGAGLSAVEARVKRTFAELRWA